MTHIHLLDFNAQTESATASTRASTTTTHAGKSSTYQGTLCNISPAEYYAMTSVVWITKSGRRKKEKEANKQTMLLVSAFPRWGACLSAAVLWVDECAQLLLYLKENTSVHITVLVWSKVLVLTISALCPLWFNMKFSDIFTVCWYAPWLERILFWW